MSDYDFNFTGDVWVEEDYDLEWFTDTVPVPDNWPHRIMTILSPTKIFGTSYNKVLTID